MEQNYISLAEIQARPLPPGFETAAGPIPHSLLNDQKKIHLELQVLQQDFWTDRSLCYLCRDFGDLNAGDSYDMVKPLIQIDIIDFDLYENSREFYSTYHLANDKTGKIYSDKLALHVLELNKEEYATEEDKHYHIDYWARLFKATTWEELKMLASEQKVLESTVETMYRINADEYVRAELRAREDELRVQRTIERVHERLNNTISEQKSTIAQQQVTIDEQAKQLANKDAELADKDAELTEQKAEIAEQKAEIARLRALLENR